MYNILQDIFIDMNNMILRLKAKIASKEYILNGSLLKQYKRCGKVNCRCSNEDKKFWHGPYWILTWKENGKTITKTLNNDQAQATKKAIKEMKELNIILGKWKAQSLKEIGKM